MDVNKTIKDKLLSASLSESEMALWESTLGSLKENMRKDILEALNSRADAVRILTDNLIAKTHAVESGDLKQWEKVLEDDKAIINKN